MAMDSSKARKRIESCPDLPTLPSVATRIVQLANSPQTNAADVGKLIEQDQALTTKVLRLVNSAFYGFPGQIKTVQHAVVILGFNKVKNVVLSASLFDLAESRKGRGLDIPTLWEHGLGVAVAAQVLADEMGGSLQGDDAFVAGLIHDLGKVILNQVLPKEYDEVFAHLEANPVIIAAAEKEVLGFDHSQVGLWIAENWRLPRPLQQAIRYHHHPTSAREEGDLVAVTHLADILTRALDVGNGGDNRMPEINKALWQRLSLDYAFLDKALGAYIKSLKSAEEFFKLIETSSR